MMSGNVKVSIIMPSLNVSGFIEEAIISVREQVLNDIEIICIDAGSTDGTREIISRQANEDSRIIVINSPVKSYGYQVNKGIDLARGEYIAILETDDYVHRDMYGSLYEIAVAEDLDYVKCDYDAYTVDDNGNRIFSSRKVGRERLFYETLFVPLEHPDVAFDDWYLWNGIYKADFLKKNNIRFSETNGAAFQDIGFLHKVTAKATKGRYLDRSLYNYCVSRPDASSNSGRTLFYIRQEYELLWDDTGKEADLNELHLLYRRMAKSFVRACMDCDVECLEDEEAIKIVAWFKEMLLGAEDRDLLSSAELPVSFRKIYHYLIGTTDGYTAYRRNRSKDIRSFLGKNNPIVIFGCGVYGRKAYKYLMDLGYEVTCFMDNSEKLWGSNIEGLNVENPEGIIGMSKDVRFIVANENHADEIATQIEAYANHAKVFIF